MGNRYVSGPGFHVSYMEPDACFRDARGRAVIMSFHTMMGPMFEDKHGTEVDPTPAIWRQFNGWWNAKGRHKYAPGSGPVPIQREGEEEELVTLKVRGAEGYIYELADVPLSEILGLKEGDS